MQELRNSELEYITNNNYDYFILYLYTPLCGTCQVASKILGVIEELLPALQMFKADLNYFPKLAEEFQIESVPCLLLLQNGRLKEKIYAFQSVPYIYEKLKKIAK
ncbi:thioredoxin family protein [Bacillus sp. FJAT-49736]|uniref:thioredoxin family protein n=1 Tax=Bacillus sp. FJAT-49736 TaxID=2833582 RepID=UPI001BCA4811|nr:thioredoxin family protein [Bacillus sp. FJAT-49736]